MELEHTSITSEYLIRDLFSSDIWFLTFPENALSRPTSQDHKQDFTCYVYYFNILILSLTCNFDQYSRFQATLY